MRALTRTTALLAIVVAAACEPTGPADPSIALARLSLSTKRVSLGLDEQQQLTLQNPLPPGSSVTWQSLDPNIAPVSNSGIVTGRSIGATMIVAASRRSTDTATVVVHAPIAKITLLPESMSILVGQSTQATVAAYDKAGRLITGLNNSSGKWNSTVPSVASVSSTGVVQALSVGSAAVTFEMNGKSDTTLVTVVTVPVASLTVSPAPSAAVNVGSLTKLVAVAKDANGNILQNRAISWTSSDSSRIYVMGDGSVTATNTGSAVVTASAEGKSAQTTVSALPAVVAAVAIAVNASNIQVGQSTQAVATATDSSGNSITGRTVTWSSSAPSVATVSSAGVITGVSVGTSNINATVDGVSASITETVSTSTVANVSVVLGSSSILVGGTTQATATATDASGNIITGRTVTWNSSNASIATVSNAGVVTAAGAGTVSISGAVDGITSGATLVVTSPTVASITVTAPSSSITAGQTLQATATVLDPSGAKLNTTVTWSSSAPTVAGVSSSGLISGLNGGTAIITASAGGKSGSVTITVQAGTAAPLPSGATDAELPRVYLNTAMSNTPSAGRTLRVAAGGNLQAALDSAVPGDKLLLAAGATFRGSFTIGPKAGGISGGWITVMSDGTLPPEGTRVSPTLAGSFPKLVSTSVLPALATNGPAARWRLIGLEFTNDAAITTVNGTVYLGDGGSAQNSLSFVPTDIVLDRVYVHGQSTTDDRRCVNFNGARLAIVDSYVSDCHSKFDAQAITGTNGPGPFKIVNNYLEASGENIAWGGADPHIPDLVPSDMEIRHNHFFKPLAWRGTWLAKNLYESKNSRRVLLDGNVFENSYPDGQAGYAIVLWSVNQDGGCTWCITQDVTFTNNVIKNATSGFQLSAKYGATSSPAMHHVTIRNNVIIGLDNPLVAGGTSRLFTMNDIIPQLTIEHNTGFAPDATLIWGGAAPLPDHLIRNNLIGGGSYQIFTSYGTGSLAWAHEAGPGSDFAGNVVALASDVNAIPNNFYPQTLNAIGLVGGGGVAYSLSATIDQLALSATSAYRGKATDGSDPGVMTSTLAAAIAGVVQP